MRKMKSIFLILFCFFGASDFLLAIKGSWNVQMALERAGAEQKVLVHGKIEKPLDFDNYVLESGEKKMVVNFSDVNHKLKSGDSILIYGVFSNESEFIRYEAEVRVRKFIDLKDRVAVQQMVKKYGHKMEPNKKEVIEEVETENKSVEQRLEKLESLKNKKIIDEKEYKRHRDRILSDL